MRSSLLWPRAGFKLDAELRLGQLIGRGTVLWSHAAVGAAVAAVVATVYS